MKVLLKKYSRFYTSFSNSVFECHNPKALRFVIKLCLALSNLHYHKFKHQDSLNQLCNSSLNIESTSHWLLHCPLFADKRKTFLSNTKSVNHKFQEQNNSTLTQTLLLGDAASKLIHWVNFNDQLESAESITIYYRYL